MSARATHKYLTAKCATCGRPLRAEPGAYVYSRYTGSHYCTPCAIAWPKTNRRKETR